ncbi:AcrR family transcriptional regulator [Nocardia sp. GAS34]|uniref:TetR/AcrR family transcriptional regulator n=1 Tax=unclassified Nocardia TaxID=2637762 RepID=UPI003D1CD613
MPEPSPPVRRTGGRSARVRGAVVESALHVLFELGPDQFTVAEVAARAGVHETSIYRRWRTRENLIVDAMLANTGEMIPTPDTGSVRGDLTALVRALAAFLAQPAGETFVRAAAMTVDDSDVAEARRTFWQSRLHLATAIVERGIERGELPPDTDAGLLLETVVAPLYLRILLTHEPIDGTFPERVVDLVLHP